MARTHDAPHLNGIRGFVLDLDGTLIRGDRALPGAVEFVTRLRQAGMPFVFCTQDPENTDDVIATRLQRMGFPAEIDDIISGGTVIIDYLRSTYGDVPIRTIGTDRQIRYLEQHGIALATGEEATPALLIGLYAGFSSAEVETACEVIWSGADFLATACDRSFPVHDGFVPGAGPLVRAVEHATRRRARVLGKPSRHMASAALRRLGVPAGDVLVIGDNIDVDISMGKAAGCRTALVLSGSASVARTKRVPARQRPDMMIENIAVLLQALPQ